MNFFEKCIYSLQVTMNRPRPYGWFHLLCIFLVIISLIFLYTKRKNHSDEQLKIVLLVYGITAFVFEMLKQIMWSFNYDYINNIVVWDYEWYSFPFQLCTTPIFVCLICAFLKKNKLRNALLSYMAFVTILGSFMTIILPESCFVEDILVNIHTMWLHCGSFVVSIYLLMTGEVKIKNQNLLYSLLVFIIFVVIAQVLNIGIYNSGILNGETFNMFFISPYFISTLPVFDIVQQSVPYIIYFYFYLLVLSLGACIVYFVSIVIKKMLKN